MAKYHGKAGCGHDYEISLYGKHIDRQRRLDWMESKTGMCNPCYAKLKREEERQAAVEREAEIERLVTMGMAQLMDQLLMAMPSDERAAKISALEATLRSSSASHNIQWLAMERVLREVKAERGKGWKQQ